MTDRIDVLDHGYVRFVDKLGTDLTVVNAARVSYDKESTELRERDKGLIAFLGDNDHTSPFRHAVIQFEVYAPLMVARQWWKYVVGSDHTMDAWNESSRRYVTEEPVFFVPNEWRSAPGNRKQGSGPTIKDEGDADAWTRQLVDHYQRGLQLYEAALSRQVAPEQARLFLPAYAMYVRWRWTASLQAVMHFLNQRLGDDAQYEIQKYAEAVSDLTYQHFPESFTALFVP